MLFKRRRPESWVAWLRVLIWPRRSWMRSGQYVAKRVLRITATPHAVAAGVAAGAFTSFTPLMGLHFLTAAALAWIMRGNLLASALGTFFGNPLTFPFIWATALSTGRWMMGLDHESAPMDLGTAMTDVLGSLWSFDGEQAARGLAAIWEPVFLPMLIGGVPWGLLVGAVAYWLTYRAALVFREARRNKLMAKAARIRDHMKERQRERSAERAADAAIRAADRSALP